MCCKSVSCVNRSHLSVFKCENSYVSHKQSSISPLLNTLELHPAAFIQKKLLIKQGLCSARSYIFQRCSRCEVVWKKQLMKCSRLKQTPHLLSASMDLFAHDETQKQETANRYINIDDTILKNTGAYKGFVKNDHR